MKISVFISSYNQKAYLVEAIDSVLAQTRRADEIIIVDDCSSDGSQSVIEQYARRHPRLIRAFCHPQNLGIPRNKGFALRQATGDLVTYLDGDDRFLPRKLEVELETYNSHPKAAIIYSNVHYIDRHGERTGTWADDQTPCPTGDVFRETFGRQFPGGSLYRNELMDLGKVRQADYYDPQFAIYEDWELRIRMTRRYQVAYTNEPLVEYRLHGKGISGVQASRHLDVTKRIYRKNRHLLKDSSPADRAYIKQHMRNRITHLARRAARQALDRGQRGRALRYWLEAIQWDFKRIDVKTPVEILTPQWTHAGLGAVYRRFSHLPH